MSQPRKNGVVEYDTPVTSEQRDDVHEVSTPWSDPGVQLWVYCSHCKRRVPVSVSSLRPHAGVSFGLILSFTTIHEGVVSSRGSHRLLLSAQKNGTLDVRADAATCPHRRESR